MKQRQIYNEKVWIDELQNEVSFKRSLNKREERRVRKNLEFFINRIK